jgi:protein gp37
MSDDTAISWCDRTWSPWEGCTKVGPGCDHCYAEARNRRFAGGMNWGPGAPRRRSAGEGWQRMRRWDAEAAERGRPITVFPSICDPFDNEVPEAWRRDFLQLVDTTPHLRWLLLTKRIGNAAAMLGRRERENVWLGATVVNQAEADRDVPKLLTTPARVRFLSIEPMLGPINLLTLDADARTPLSRLHWVIAGGESGPHARPPHPAWFQSLRDQCAAAGVPFHFKQWGEWGLPTEPKECDCTTGRRHNFGDVVMHRVGLRLAGRALDNVEHNGFPS